ncbi:MBL fold metallo-hydrolase, partial [Petrachloros mirabilis]
MSEHIRIRMYHVGFGDCILVTFPKNLHMLVDCGVHWEADMGQIPNAVNNIEEVTKGRLNVVVGTHRHVDHLSGFDSEKNAFARMTVDEVWLSFVMNDQDPAGSALLAWEQRLAQACEAEALPIAQTLSLLAASNNRAIKTLTEGFANKPGIRWMPEDKEVLKTDALPGAKVQILGPQRDNKYTSIGDPKGGDAYLDAYLSDIEVAAVNGRQPPFDERWVLPDKDVRKYFPELKAQILPKNESDLEDILAATGAVINNSSVNFLLTYGDAVMLFAGDTQYGGWLSIYESTNLESQLQKITFLKVSHHGSHNGTPATLIDRMGRFVSIVPTNHPEPFESIPREPLLDALKEHGPVVRS